MEATLAGVDERLGAALGEIKSLINRMTMQQNELRSHMAYRDHGVNGGSILGQPMGATREIQGSTGQGNNRYAIKLEFPRFGREDIEDWLFRVE